MIYESIPTSNSIPIILFLFTLNYLGFLLVRAEKKIIIPENVIYCIIIKLIVKLIFFHTSQS